MDNYENYKEVFYDKYCKSCLYKDVPEGDDPCDECLTYPGRPCTHKPINYKENKKGVK